MRGGNVGAPRAFARRMGDFPTASVSRHGIQVHVCKSVDYTPIVLTSTKLPVDPRFLNTTAKNAGRGCVEYRCVDTTLRTSGGADAVRRATRRLRVCRESTLRGKNTLATSMFMWCVHYFKFGELQSRLPGTFEVLSGQHMESLDTPKSKPICVRRAAGCGWDIRRND